MCAAPQAKAAPSEPIEFNADALLQILHWAQSPDSAEPPEWRQQLPYVLARDQAKWSGRPSSDLEVERQLRLIQERKQKDPGPPLLTDAAQLARRIMEGHQEFLGGAVPHLRAYLPPGTPIRGTVALAAFLPNYAFSMNETIVVSITDSFWEKEPARVFNLLVHELFHNGFIRHQPGEAASNAANGPALFRMLLWSVQNEGLATYVAYRAKPAGLGVADYRLLENPEEVERRFDLCRRSIQDIQRATKQKTAALKERLWQEGNNRRVSYIVGAAMARRIEQVGGRLKLLQTIEGGPQAFLDAYRATSPPEPLGL